MPPLGRWHQRLRGSYAPWLAQWIIATGRVFGRACLAYCHPRSFINGRSRWSTDGRSVGALFGPWGTLPGTYARMFGATYRAHALVPDGTAAVDGRRVARFKSIGTQFRQTWIAWRPGTRPPVKVRNPQYIYSRIDWYVDPATARLIGLGAWGCMADQIRSCEGPKHPPLATRIVTFQRLDPTAQNLAQLTGPGAPPAAR